jgi:hypothetical protein
MVLDYFAVDLVTILTILTVLGTFAVIIEYRLYARFKKIVQNDDTVIERQKTLLNEKITL